MKRSQIHLWPWARIDTKLRRLSLTSLHQTQQLFLRSTRSRYDIQFSLPFRVCFAFFFYLHDIWKPSPSVGAFHDLLFFSHPSEVISGLIDRTEAWGVYANACCHVDIWVWRLMKGHLKEVLVKMRMTVGVWTYRLFMWLSGTLSVTQQGCRGVCVCVCVCERERV